ncbi:MAG: hypothetical protein NUV69_04620 [Candidatus Curtissbacteria bacterium]|nr:hypothetical protein [Candidatus Curtissbacteria bacterium]
MNASRRTYIIAGVSIFLIMVAVYFLFIFNKGAKKLKADDSEGEVKEITELKADQKPFVTLTPTSDGAEIIISIENMSYFDNMEYELTYLADNPTIRGEKLTRGATDVNINTKDAKYKKSLLLGTASRGTRSPDTGVADGKLTLHLFKDETEYRSETTWDLYQVGATAGTTKDRTGNFTIEIPKLVKAYWLIVADTVGVPPNPQGFEASDVRTPVYGTFSVAPEFAKPVNVTIKAEGESPKLYIYDHQNTTWSDANSEYSSGALSATTGKFATFVVVSPK